MLLLLLAWGAREARAIQLTAVYLSACRREVGVILKVDREQVQMLTLDGAVQTLSRFDIIYIAFYPVGEPPIAKVDGNDKVKLVTIRTIYRGQPRVLVRGWMMDYAEHQISFLTTEGAETVIDRDDIWSIEMEPQPETIRFPERQRIPYSFGHPFPFVHCAYEDAAPSEAGESPRTVLPQTQLGDPLLIKRELDRLEEGYARAESYQRSQKFYAIPQFYRNETLLGISVSAGTRYGATGTRKNSFIPVIYSGLSEGPFGFQRQWVAGAAPMPYSVHEEPQTQLYYRLKADYLHFSFQYDINQAIIGSSNYEWKPADLSSNDDRWSEIFHLGGGFDYGALAFDLAISVVGYAVQQEENFFENKTELVRLGAFYQLRTFKMDFYYGFGNDQKPSIEELAQGNSEQDVADAAARLAAIPEFHTKLRYLRLNLGFPGVGEQPLAYSMIYRWLDFVRMEDLEGAGAFSYVGRSFTNALYQDVSLNEDLTLSLFLSVEHVSNRFGPDGLDGAAAHTFLKGGASIRFRL